MATQPRSEHTRAFEALPRDQIDRRILQELQPDAITNAEPGRRVALSAPAVSARVACHRINGEDRFLLELHSPVARRRLPLQE